MTTLRIEDMTLEDLGRYMVTLPDWRYIPGMVTAKDDVIIDGGLRYFCVHCIGGLDEYQGEWPVNVSHPGTIGGMTELVRRRWHRPGIHTRCIQRPIHPNDGQDVYIEWCVCDDVLNLYGDRYMPTEAHALALALAWRLP